jgi:outer membrane lipoprotein
VNKALLVVFLSATLTACATAPVVLRGEFAELNPAQSATAPHAGERVRWGGEIIRVEPGEVSTCFEILSRELDASARPGREDGSQGRFIACRSGFYDPEVFVKGRELTITGTLDGKQLGQVGQFDYTYPKVAADTIYLWPRRPLVVTQRPAWPFYDPFWGPGFGPYWRSGFWGPPPIVIVKPDPGPRQ